MASTAAGVPCGAEQAKPALRGLCSVEPTSGRTFVCWEWTPLSGACVRSQHPPLCSPRASPLLLQALQQLPQMLPHFALVLAAAELPSHTLASVRGACQHLRRSHSAALQQLLAALPADVGNVILSA